MPSNNAGPNGPGTGVNDNSVGDVAWSNPDRITADDGSAATAAILITQFSNYLKGTNFGFNIPGDAVITGILLEIDRSGTQDLGGSCEDEVVSLVKGGVVAGTNKAATGVAWPTSSAFASYGGVGDLWGLAWSPMDINATNFGAVLQMDTAGATQT